ncbi:hypothetical protein [Chondromyces crocatus]|uniref:Copper type II ascorbate-dependent monooxygenase C-terminal domain-containing protein n=1 Tax=Chondromyces crocatus TaxID=52 RepID=A0A0K1EFE9_CHOCO|nr:hypothetical protein [Chondromyces crocatus]AKT39585.1 uncharacterized protein CMC5_037340 [Chondromyces crocatus]
MLLRRHALITSLSLVALTACGSDSSGGAPGGPTPQDACAELLETCLARQQACEVADGAASCVACPSGHYAAASGHCARIEGASTAHEFEKFTVQPGEEVSGLCQSWTLQNAEALWVNAVELSQDAASHHSNWTYVPANLYDGPDGVWPCSERNYHQLSAAVSGGVLYAQSTQAAQEVQRFPNGAAVRIPPYARIIGDVHLLNTSPTPISGSVRLTLYTLPESEVEVKLVPFHLTYHGLDLPPRATSRFSGACKVSDAFQGATGKPLEMDIYYLLPHYHTLGQRFFLEQLGGPDAGRAFFDGRGQEGEAKGRSYDPPQRVENAEGFTFGCEFENPRSERVGWGLGDQEMCEILGFADAAAAFESTVSTATPDGTDEHVQRFTGACGTLAFPWNHDKEGGPPPP